MAANTGTLVVDAQGKLNVPGHPCATPTGADLLTRHAEVTAGKVVAKSTGGLTISGDASLSVSGGNLQIGLGSGDADNGSLITATQYRGNVTISGSGTFIVGSYFSGFDLDRLVHPERRHCRPGPRKQPSIRQ